MLGESRKMSYLCSRNSDSPSQDLKTATSAGCKAARVHAEREYVSLFGWEVGKTFPAAG